MYDFLPFEGDLNKALLHKKYRLVKLQNNFSRNGFSESILKLVRVYSNLA
jgi:hypothetical protein